MRHDYMVDKQLRAQLGKSLMFKYVDDDRKDQIISVSDILDFSDGMKIIREGDDSPHLYVVIQGQVSVNVTDAQGREVYLTTIGEGGVFGEAGIFLKAARTANVVSIESARVLRIHRTELLNFIKRDPAAGIKLLMIIIYGLLRKLRESNQELAFERRTDVVQDDIDALVESLMKE